MKYCQYCGAKLEEGQQCTCQVAQQVAARQAAAAQQPAARPAAPVQQPAVRPAPIPPKQHAVVPRSIQNQGQREELQKTMAQAGQSARAAGKAAWSSAKSLAGSAQGALSNGAGAQGAALYRMAMMAFGALHILLFFILSYAKLNSQGVEMKLFSQLTGFNFPRNMTAINFIRFAQDSANFGVADAGDALTALVVLFGVPVLCGVLLIVLNLKKKARGMIGSIVLSVLTLLDYLVIKLFIGEMASSFSQMGYKTGFGFSFVVVMLIVVLQIVVAIMGHVAAKKAGTAA